MKKRAQPGMVESEKVIPAEYFCPICKKIMNNAVVVPCCGESFCDTCKLIVIFIYSVNSTLHNSFKLMSCSGVIL